MTVKYKTDSEIFAVVRSFEDATIARTDWRHTEHLTVALYYASHHEFETALGKMRSGILSLLRSFDVDLAKEMPYHETLTVFWMRTVAEFNASKNGTSFVDKANELVANFDKDYPMKFYSREYLFSDEARAAFVEGDI